MAREITLPGGAIRNENPEVQMVAGVTAAGASRALLVDDDGVVQTSGGGGGGSGGATEETLGDFRDMALGRNGAIYVTGTTAQAGVFCAVSALSDAVIASMTAPGIGGAALADIPLPAGMSIYGAITAFTLTSGKVVAYKA